MISIDKASFFPSGLHPLSEFVHFVLLSLHNLVASCCVDICDSQKAKFKKRMIWFVAWRGKISPYNKTINSFTKVGISGLTMIHCVNKITEANFQTVTGFIHEKI